MKKMFLALAVIVSIKSNCSYLSSSLFSTATVPTLPVEVTQGFIESTKESICGCIKRTIEPLTTFAYNNMLLSLGTATVIGIAAYKAGKYAHMPAYSPNDVERVTVVARR